MLEELWDTIKPMLRLETHAAARKGFDVAERALELRQSGLLAVAANSALRRQRQEALEAIRKGNAAP